MEFEKTQTEKEEEFMIELLSSMFIKTKADFAKLDECDDRFAASQLNIDLIRQFDRLGGFEHVKDEEFQIRFAGFESLMSEQTTNFII